MTVRFDQAYWDERYQSQPALWSGRPNPYLVSETAELAPGRALEVGCGEGADAIWLAQRQWQVTAVDISSVALERARKAAEQSSDVAARITWVRADLSQWRPEEAAYDLVNAQFFSLPPALRLQVWAALVAAVAPGGTLLVVAHDITDCHMVDHRHAQPELFFDGAEVVASIPDSGWTIVTNSVTTREDPEGAGHADVVVRALRHPPGRGTGAPRP